MPVLVPHPETPCSAVRRLEVRVARGGGRLRLRYELEGNLAALVLPEPGPPQRCDGLWEHTCFEAFLALPVAEAYGEHNFAPSGAWAAYAFQAYRTRIPGEVGADPGLRVTRGADRLELEATVPDPAPDQVLRLALTAVVEARDGGCTYWSLRHPPGAPDFHHAEAFALELLP